MITYIVSKSKLDFAKKYRSHFSNRHYHGFYWLYLIRKIKVELETNTVIVYWKFGCKKSYKMEKLSFYYLLRDCGFSDAELENSLLKN